MAMMATLATFASANPRLIGISIFSTDVSYRFSGLITQSARKLSYKLVPPIFYFRASRLSEGIARGGDS
jgi:hypothetical protein